MLTDAPNCETNFFSPVRLMKAKMTYLTASIFFTSLFCNIFLINGSPLTSNENGLGDEQKNLNRFDLSDIYQPTTETEQAVIDQFEPSRLNYTAVKVALDDWLSSTSDRSGQFEARVKLPKFLSGLTNLVDLDQVIKDIKTSIVTSVSCNACHGGIGFLRHFFSSRKPKSEMVDIALRLCIALKISTPNVCYGCLNLMIDQVVFLARNVDMKADEICEIIIGDSCELNFTHQHDWQVTFPPIPKPSIETKEEQQGSTPLKVLQISDTHFDPEYVAGSNADCDEPLCCRSTSGTAESKEQTAGLYGDYRNCDIPKRTMTSMFEHIAHTHPDIDYIMWTGDLPPHDVWNQSKASNTNILKDTVQQFLTYFPNTTIFPALGNHESVPINSFPPSHVPKELGVDWLYKVCHDEWLRWLPKETGPTILKGGFYSVLVRPTLRILSINTNFCYSYNWWILLNTTDPGQELQWMIYELQGAEIRGEKVHIIGHIPPGYVDCMKVWSRNYYSIINRYESTITGQFFGHTHLDEYEIFYDNLEPTRATNVAYIGPSVTTFIKLNPSYRIYQIGADEMVLDHETWIMHLDEANAVGRPHWYQLYSARRDYGLRSLHPQEWDNLIYRMSENQELFDMYYRFYWRNSPVREKCDKKCKKRMLCDLKSARSHDREVTCK